MATLSTLTNRLLVAGGFAVAIAAAPVVVTLSTPAGVAAHSVAECPTTEVQDPVSGACQPVSDVAPQTQSPINPENATLEPGSLTQGTGSGNVGELPSIDGVPCTGHNIGQCIGLQQSQGANNVTLPPVPVGVTP